MNYSHFISSVQVGDLLTDGKNTNMVIRSEFYVCGTSRILVKNLKNYRVFELTEFDQQCKKFIHGPIAGEFDS